MKQHLKRISSPKTWVINRKENTFIVRPKPGPHSFKFGLPLGVILRDEIKIASTMSEVKKILNSKEILIDGKRRKDHRLIVGLFDVLTIPVLKKSYRVILSSKGKILVKEIDQKEISIKVCKIVGKKLISKGKIQYNLHDGRNIIGDEQAKVGDSFVVDLPNFKISSVLSLKPGMKVFLTSGRHAGGLGTLKEIKGKEALYTSQDKDVETAKDYLFVVGDKESLITTSAESKIES